MRSELSQCSPGLSWRSTRASEKPSDGCICGAQSLGLPPFPRHSSSAAVFSKGCPLAFVANGLNVWGRFWNFMVLPAGLPKDAPLFHVAHFWVLQDEGPLSTVSAAFQTPPAGCALNSGEPFLGGRPEDTGKRAQASCLSFCWPCNCYSLCSSSWPLFPEVAALTKGRVTEDARTTGLIERQLGTRI